MMRRRSPDRSRRPAPDRSSRPRSQSAASSSSSSSASLLDISRHYPRAARIGAVLSTFFRAPSERTPHQHHRRRRRRRRIFSFGNSSSSSSINSDLAYGNGYIARPKDYLPRRPVADDAARTDQEILDIGRQLSDFARKQNQRDLRAAGKSPSSLSALSTAAAAVTAAGLRRKRSTSSRRGIASSATRHTASDDDDDDDDDWESASGDESSDVADSELAYGSALSQPPISLRNRHNSAVDPRLFGPVNSLHGLVTPRPFSDDESTLPAAQHHQFNRLRRLEPADEKTPMRELRPMPTADPNSFDVDTLSSASLSQPRPRPAPVPIQQPVPVAPVKPKVFEADKLDQQREWKEPRLRSDKAFDVAKGASVAALALGTVVASERRNHGKEERRTKSSRHSDYERRDSERRDSERRDSERKDPERRDSEKRDSERRHRHKSPERSERRHADADRRHRHRSPERPTRVEVESDRREQEADRDKERRRSHKRDSQSSSKRSSDDRHSSSRRSDDQPRDKSARSGDEIRHGKQRDSGYDYAYTSEDPKRRRDDIVVELESERRTGKTASRDGGSYRHDRGDDYRRQVDDPSSRTGGGEDAKAREKTPINPFQFQVRDDDVVAPKPSPPRVDDRERFDDWSMTPSQSGQRRSKKDSVDEQQRPYKSQSKRRQDDLPEDEPGSYRHRNEKRGDEHVRDSAGRSIVPAAVAATVAAAAAAAAAAGTPRSKERRRDEYSDGRGPRERDDRSRDPVQEEANRHYRENARARKAAQDQIVSYPQESEDFAAGGGGGWNEDFSFGHPTIVTPPEKVKDLYGAPDADVRIDNKIYPRDITRFRPLGGDTDSALFGTRDPSCERDRPLLNLVFPTPDSSRHATPGPDAAGDEDDGNHHIESPPSEEPVYTTVGGSKGEMVTQPSTPKSVTWGENSTKRFEVESPEPRSDVEYAARETGAHPAERSRPALEKSSRWGAIADAFTGSKYTEPESESQARDIKKPSSTREVREGKGARSGQVSVDESSTAPPVPGPKPERMPGGFSDDIDFAATLAAGLEDSGFDPDIVINDPAYRRRESPPGESEPNGDDWGSRAVIMEPKKKQDTPGEKAVREAGRASGETDTPRNEPSAIEEWSEAPKKLSKKERRRLEKEKSEQQSSDAVAPEDPSLVTVADAEPTADDSWAEVPKNMSKKEKKRLEKLERQASDAAPENPSIASAAYAEPTADDSWAEVPKNMSKKEKKKLEKLERQAPDAAASSESPSLVSSADAPRKVSKKEQRKLDKEAKQQALMSPKDKEDTEIVNEPKELPKAEDDDWEEAGRKKKSPKGKKDRVFEDEDDAATSKISVPTDAFDDLQSFKKTAPDDEWDKWETPSKHKKGRKRDSRDSPTTSVAPSEVAAGSSQRRDKKSKQKGGIDDGADSSDEPPSRQKRSPFEDRDVSSVVSEPRHDDRKQDKRSSKRRSSRYGDNDDEDLDDDTKSAASAPGPSRHRSKEPPEKKGGGRFSSFFKSGGNKEEAKKDSFFESAGTFGAGVGLAMATAAGLVRPHATESSTERERDALEATTTTTTTDPPLSPARAEESTVGLDPDIAPRAIKPAIDPQYGDLLPLPPSEPGSPREAPTGLPSLPDSRPSTPPDERSWTSRRDYLTRHHRRGRSMQEIPTRTPVKTPTKTPSSTAIPISWRLGQRGSPTTPSSSTFRSVAAESPVAASDISSSKRRARHVSWDSSREMIPLCLLRRPLNMTTTKHHSRPQQLDEVPADDDGFRSSGLPSIPPSEPLSRQSPEPDDAGGETVLEGCGLGTLSTVDPRLRIDTGNAAPSGGGDDTGSEGEMTPKAELQPELPALPPSDDDDVDRQKEEEDGRPQQFEPDPVESTSKNRSSYLLLSSSPSAGSSNSAGRESALQSPTRSFSPSSKQIVGSRGGARRISADDLNSPEDHFSDAMEVPSEDDDVVAQRGVDDLSSARRGSSPREERVGSGGSFCDALSRVSSAWPNAVEEEQEGEEEEEEKEVEQLPRDANITDASLHSREKEGGDKGLEGVGGVDRGFSPTGNTGDAVPEKGIGSRSIHHGDALAVDDVAGSEADIDVGTQAEGAPRDVVEDQANATPVDNIPESEADIDIDIFTTPKDAPRDAAPDEGIDTSAVHDDAYPGDKMVESEADIDVSASPEKTPLDAVPKQVVDTPLTHHENAFPVDDVPTSGADIDLFSAEGTSRDAAPEKAIEISSTQAKDTPVDNLPESEAGTDVFTVDDVFPSAPEQMSQEVSPSRDAGVAEAFENDEEGGEEQDAARAGKSDGDDAVLAPGDGHRVAEEEVAVPQSENDAESHAVVMPASKGLEPSSDSSATTSLEAAGGDEEQKTAKTSAFNDDVPAAEDDFKNVGDHAPVTQSGHQVEPQAVIVPASKGVGQQLDTGFTDERKALEEQDGGHDAPVADTADLTADVQSVYEAMMATVSATDNDEAQRLEETRAVNVPEVTQDEDEQVVKGEKSGSHVVSNTETAANVQSVYEAMLKSVAGNDEDGLGKEEVEEEEARSIKALQTGQKEENRKYQQQSAVNNAGLVADVQSVYEAMLRNAGDADDGETEPLDDMSREALETAPEDASRGALETVQEQDPQSLPSTEHSDHLTAIAGPVAEATPGTADDEVQSLEDTSREALETAEEEHQVDLSSTVITDPTAHIQPMSEAMLQTAEDPQEAISREALETSAQEKNQEQGQQDLPLTGSIDPIAHLQSVSEAVFGTTALDHHEVVPLEDECRMETSEPAQDLEKRDPSGDIVADVQSDSEAILGTDAAIIDNEVVPREDAGRIQASEPAPEHERQNRSVAADIGFDIAAFRVAHHLAEEHHGAAPVHPEGVGLERHEATSEHQEVSLTTDYPGSKVGLPQETNVAEAVEPSRQPEQDMANIIDPGMSVADVNYQITVWEWPAAEETGEERDIKSESDASPREAAAIGDLAGPVTEVKPIDDEDETEVVEQDIGSVSVGDVPAIVIDGPDTEADSASARSTDAPTPAGGNVRSYAGIRIIDALNDDTSTVQSAEAENPREMDGEQNVMEVVNPSFSGEPASAAFIDVPIIRINSPSTDSGLDDTDLVEPFETSDDSNAQVSFEDFGFGVDQVPAAQMAQVEENDEPRQEANAEQDSPLIRILSPSSDSDLGVTDAGEADELNDNSRTQAGSGVISDEVSAGQVREVGKVEEDDEPREGVDTSPRVSPFISIDSPDPDSVMATDEPASNDKTTPASDGNLEPKVDVTLLAQGAEVEERSEPNEQDSSAKVAEQPTSAPFTTGDGSREGPGSREKTNAKRNSRQKKKMKNKKGRASLGEIEAESPAGGPSEGVAGSACDLLASTETEVVDDEALVATSGSVDEAAIHVDTLPDRALVSTDAVDSSSNTVEASSYQVDSTPDPAREQSDLAVATPSLPVNTSTIPLDAPSAQADVLTDDPIQAPSDPRHVPPIPTDASSEQVNAPHHKARDQTDLREASSGLIDVPAVQTDVLSTKVDSPTEPAEAPSDLLDSPVDSADSPSSLVEALADMIDNLSAPRDAPSDSVGVLLKKVDASSDPCGASSTATQPGVDVAESAPEPLSIMEKSPLLSPKLVRGQVPSINAEDQRAAFTGSLSDVPPSAAEATAEFSGSGPCTASEEERVGSDEPINASSAAKAEMLEPVELGKPVASEAVPQGLVAEQSQIDQVSPSLEVAALPIENEAEAIEVAMIDASSIAVDKGTEPAKLVETFPQVFTPQGHAQDESKLDEISSSVEPGAVSVAVEDEAEPALVNASSIPVDDKVESDELILSDQRELSFADHELEESKHDETTSSAKLAALPDAVEARTEPSETALIDRVSIAVDDELERAEGISPTQREPSSADPVHEVSKHGRTAFPAEISGSYPTEGDEVEQAKPAMMEVPSVIAKNQEQLAEVYPSDQENPSDRENPFADPPAEEVKHGDTALLAEAQAAMSYPIGDNEDRQPKPSRIDTSFLATESVETSPETDPRDQEGPFEQRKPSDREKPLADPALEEPKDNEFTPAKPTQLPLKDNVAKLPEPDLIEALSTATENREKLAKTIGSDDEDPSGQEKQSDQLKPPNQEMPASADSVSKGSKDDENTSAEVTLSNLVRDEVVKSVEPASMDESSDASENKEKAAGVIPLQPETSTVGVALSTDEATDKTGQKGKLAIATGKTAADMRAATGVIVGKVSLLAERFGGSKKKRRGKTKAEDENKRHKGDVSDDEALLKAEDEKSLQTEGETSMGEEHPGGVEAAAEASKSLATLVNENSAEPEASSTGVSEERDESPVLGRNPPEGLLRRESDAEEPEGGLLEEQISEVMAEVLSSRPLPAVQEFPEAEAAAEGVKMDDGWPLRDSGIGGGSPKSWARRAVRSAQRDSGVHTSRETEEGRIVRPVKVRIGPRPEAGLVAREGMGTGAGAGAGVEAGAGPRSAEEPGAGSDPQQPIQRSSEEVGRQGSPFRPDSPGIDSFPPLRRVSSRSATADLRRYGNIAAERKSKPKPKSKPSSSSPPLPSLSLSSSSSSSSATPVANEGRVRAMASTDVLDGFGEGRVGSPMSPTRPHSMRRRQSMQVLELEARVDQLLAENRLLVDGRARSEAELTARAAAAVAARDGELDSLRQSLRFSQAEVARLAEVNDGLTSANAELAARDNRDASLAEANARLDVAEDQIRRLQRELVEAKTPSFLRLLDEDHFEGRCQRLSSHVRQWVIRFSKFSDMRPCRLTAEIDDDKTVDRLDDAMLDGTDVDLLLRDRVRRRDVFMSVTMNMIWEFVFTRYLFGMDREQRQKLKSLEKLLSDVGPAQAVRQWRSVTLTLLSRRDGFHGQRDLDTEAVVQAIYKTLSRVLPPPLNLEAQVQSQLRRVVREAVDLSIEMRTQRSEYVMLPPSQPEYDAEGKPSSFPFDATTMTVSAGAGTAADDDEEKLLQDRAAAVRLVLFPLVVKRGDDQGLGDENIVISPAQVLVASDEDDRIGSAARHVTPSSDAGGASLAAPSRVSLMTEKSMDAHSDVRHHHLASGA
ncbi:hypothetical protein CP533_5893 [Ophiocordyceps camponoti-saundersi (nom. inval.)]|nr:hypothetical protein CP533_5893 [Ophiocordyceps camponoti-saundersi (nom. inval.)]